MLEKVQATAPKRPSTTTASNVIRNNMLRKQNSLANMSTPNQDQTTSNISNDEEAGNLPPTERHLFLLEQNLLQGNNRMDKLETICIQLKHNTDIISTQIQQLANDLYNPPSPSREMQPNKAARTSD